MRHATLAFALILATPAVCSAQLVVRAAAGPPGQEFVSCNPKPRPCTFTDLGGDNVYTIDRATMSRTTGGQQTYSIPIGSKSIFILQAAINSMRSQIVIALEQRAVSTGAMFNPGSLSPGSIQTQYWLSVRNPKSGEEIKAIDLGLFQPDAIALTPSGDYVWVAGDEQQLRRREVRAYNTRSGKLEHSTVAPKNANIHLFERGFGVASTYYTAEVSTGSPIIRHSSPNAYSIAEFTVRRSAGLSPKSLGDAAIGVVGFQGATPELGEMLEGALAIKLGSAGFKVVERQRLKDLLQEARFQNLGLTDSTKATELGKLANAQYLLFGHLQTTGTVSSLQLRLVGVEDGMLKNGIELECRDCTPDDYLQGLTFLIKDWIEGT